MITEYFVKIRFKSGEIKKLRFRNKEVAEAYSYKLLQRRSDIESVQHETR